MSTLRTALVLACALGTAPPSLIAQEEVRIWGRVTTTSGDRHEGFIRWDRNEAGWWDILDGSRERSAEAYQAWLDAVRDGERPVRSLDLHGYRITWNEEDPDFPSLATSGIRFGHVARLEVQGDDQAELTLRSGRTVLFSRGSTDIGTTLRDVIVERDGATVELKWEDLVSVDLERAPPDARPASARLHGTVEDRAGRAFTGFVSWDRDESLESDVLDGFDEDGREVDVPFGEIASIRPAPGHARVSLRSGEILDLSGTNDVGRGHRGVEVFDPELGLAQLEWDGIVEVRFHRRESRSDLGSLDGGRPLHGTVRTWDGRELTGLVRWDADEELSWELLDGRSGEVDLAVELGRVARIEPDRVDGAHVTLLDGRTFHMLGSNDVSEENKGIFVRLAADSTGGETSAPGTADPDAWTYVAWEELADVTFHGSAPGLVEERERP